MILQKLNRTAARVVQAYVHASTKGCTQQAGKTETSTQKLEVCYQQSVKADSDWQLTNGRMDIPIELRELAIMPMIQAVVLYHMHASEARDCRWAMSKWKPSGSVKW